MTADILALIISVSIILGVFENCYHEAKRAEQFYNDLKKKKERESDETGTTEERSEVDTDQ